MFRRAGSGRRVTIITLPFRDELDHISQMNTDVLDERQAETREAAETRERKAGWARGQARAREPQDHRSRPAPSTTQTPHLLDILVNSVREYAIFFLDPNGIITLWGESARLMKWWTKEEAEGAHLRMLYPDGGSEDG